jgi:PIN domain nuclease of toxin-antitoxin system
MPTESVLLDTHVVLWWHAEDDRLSSPARAAIEGARSVLVSPISSWEVATLVRKGRVGLDRPPAAWMNDLLGPGGPAESVPLTPEVAAVAGGLEGFHGDPADRLIYATALVGHLTLVTKDRRLHEAAADRDDVTTLW